MLRGETLAVEYGRHAVERYGERVRPGCSFTTTLEQLVAVVECAGRIVSEPPLWAPWDNGTSAYLVIGDDIVFPLKARGPGEYVAVTCLIRGWLPPSAHAARREQRRRKRAGRRCR